MTAPAPPPGPAGRHAFVTGGAGGLGSEIARALAAAGARVSIADRDLRAAGEIAVQLGDAALPVELDVGDEASWVRALDAAEDRFGPIEVLVNAAGFFEPEIPFERMSLELWRRHFAINCDGVFLGCRNGIERMRARGQGGVIINLGSGMSVKANATASAYCASKAAVLMTTRTAALAAGPHRIRVNAVLPGAVPTPMLMKNLRPGETPDELVDRLAGYAALGRLASPGDIARAVLFLADPRSEAITGIALPVDAGNLVGA